jgi:arylsulfatase A-like enzyme
LAQRFRERGYRTFGLAANVNVGEEMGFSRGFDRFACYPIADAAELLGYLTEWESEIGRSAPYFVYLHFMDPHTPYRRRAPWYEASDDEIEDLISRYDSDIRFLDEHLSRLPSLLELDGNTLLVVLSDHGEEFRDHGQIGHKFSLFSEVNRILLLIHAPQLGVAAQRIDRNVSLVDLVPTLMELSGASAPQGDGRSLVPLLRQEDDGAAFEERTVFAHRQQSTGRKREMWAAIRGGWKLLERDDHKTTRLYDLASDPAETRDVLREEPMVAAHLIDELVLLRAREVAGKPERIEVPVDPDRAALLRALGYVDDEPGAGTSDR